MAPDPTFVLILAGGAMLAGLIHVIDVCYLRPLEEARPLPGWGDQTKKEITARISHERYERYEGARRRWKEDREVRVARLRKKPLHHLWRVS